MRGNYGRLNFYGKHWKAHRLAWFLVKVKPPQNFLLHSCDNPKCVNPNHLREGSLQENMNDMVERKRSLIGGQKPESKIK